MRSHLTLDHFIKAAKISIPKSWTLVLKESDENSQLMHLSEIENLYKFLEDTKS